MSVCTSPNRNENDDSSLDLFPPSFFLVFWHLQSIGSFSVWVGCFPLCSSAFFLDWALYIYPPLLISYFSSSYCLLPFDRFPAFLKESHRKCELRCACVIKFATLVPVCVHKRWLLIRTEIGEYFNVQVSLSYIFPGTFGHS